jgi:hypothetical protein
MYIEDCLGGGCRRGRGKERTLRVKRMEVWCIYTYKDSIMKPTKHCLKEGEEKGGMEV